MRISNLILRLAGSLSLLTLAATISPVLGQTVDTVAPLGKEPAPVPAVPPAPAPAPLSPGVADVVKMLNAKVDPDVVKTYIANSGTAYRLSAEEIVAMKQR